MHAVVRGLILAATSVSLSIADGELVRRRQPPVPQVPIRPGVFDCWLDVFRGHPLVAALDGNEIGRLTSSGCPLAGRDVSTRWRVRARVEAAGGASRELVEGRRSALRGTRAFQ